jgi:hypothetical protein
MEMAEKNHEEQLIKIQEENVKAKNILGVSTSTLYCTGSFLPFVLPLFRDEEHQESRVPVFQS